MIIKALAYSERWQDERDHHKEKKMRKQKEHQTIYSAQEIPRKKTSRDNEVNLLPLKQMLMGRIVPSNKTLNGPSYQQFW